MLSPLPLLILSRCLKGLNIKLVGKSWPYVEINTYVHYGHILDRNIVNNGHTSLHQL